MMKLLLMLMLRETNFPDKHETARLHPPGKHTPSEKVCVCAWIAFNSLFRLASSARFSVVAALRLFPVAKVAFFLV